MRLTKNELAIKFIGWYCRNIPLSLGKTRITEILSKMVNMHGNKIFYTSFGAKMYLDLSQYVQRYIYFRGSYEPHILVLLKNITNQIKPDFFLDIGANVGQHSLYAAFSCNIKNVIAFEPDPSIFNRLVSN